MKKLLEQVRAVQCRTEQSFILDQSSYKLQTRVLKQSTCESRASLRALHRASEQRKALEIVIEDPDQSCEAERIQELLSFKPEHS